MASPGRKLQAVDSYIAGFPRPVQARLRKVRATIRANARQATEVISYSIPAYRQNGMLVYFAGIQGSHRALSTGARQCGAREGGGAICRSQGQPAFFSR